MYLLAEVTCWIMPVAIALVVFLIPCKPPFLGSILVQKDFCRDIMTNWNVTNLAIRVSLAGLDFLVMMQLCYVVNYYAYHVLLTGQYFLWIQGYDLLRSLGTRDPDLDFLLEYRKLQVVEALLRQAVRWRVFPAVSVIMPACQVLSSFALIKLHDSMPMSSILLMIDIIMASGVFSTVVFIIAAKSYSVSKECLEENRRVGGRGRIREEKKAQKSLKPVRVQFGNNFVEPLTPLIFQQFCVEHTASLLMLS